MDGCLVDTNIVSYLLKRDTRGDLYKAHLDGQRLYISIVTVGELYRWAVQFNWGADRIETLRQKLQNYIVLKPDDATAWQWARVTTVKGRPIAAADGWIAACAIRHDLALVSHNRKHFEGIVGLRLISEA